MKDYFDPSRYRVIDMETGEELPIQIFTDNEYGKYWEKAFAKTLAEFLNIGGGPAIKILAHILKIKDSNNRIGGTIREIAAETETSTKTVLRLFTKLKEAGFLKQIRSGCYMLSPHVLRHGSKTRGAMVLRLWGELGDIND